MKDLIKKVYFIHYLRYAFFFIYCTIPLSSFAEQITNNVIPVSQEPVTSLISVAPNLMFVLDNSSSMTWDYLPDELFSNSEIEDKEPFKTFPQFRAYFESTTKPFFLSENRDYECQRGDDGCLEINNTLYYNPQTSYLPPPGLDKQPLKTFDFNSVPEDGYCVSTGLCNEKHRVNLNGSWNLPHEVALGNFSPTKDYRYLVELINSRRPFYYDPKQDRYFALPSDQEQNFANWYAYYRTRILTARSAIFSVFSKLSSNIRFGWKIMNNATQNSEQVSPFEHKRWEQFYQAVLQTPTQGRTPLLKTVAQACANFENTSQTGLWGTKSEGAECRQTHMLVVTDGVWNDGYNVGHELTNLSGFDDRSPSVQGADTRDGPVYQSPNMSEKEGYKAIPPYKGSNPNSYSLSNIATHYWETDLAPNLANTVPTTTNDSAFWQHIRLYAIGIGRGANGKDPEKLKNDLVEDKTKITWGKATIDDPYHGVDDLWHAGVNGRGGFYLANSVESLQKALDEMTSSVSDTMHSLSRVTVTSSLITKDSQVFRSGFDPSGWQGWLRAYKLSKKSGITSTWHLSNVPIWDAAQGIPQWDRRKIFSNKKERNKNSGIRFDNFSTLSKMQQNALRKSLCEIKKKELLQGEAKQCSITAELEKMTDTDLQDLMDYLKGNNAKGEYRQRQGRLGDIVNSNPVYDQETKVVYVGANDGMLHAIDARDGKELFAYIPNASFEHLGELADKAYKHRFYVDGSPILYNQADKTYLLSSMGAGGRAYFALDVSQPDKFSEKEVLWEFDHDELGQTIGQAVIGKLKDDYYEIPVAIFGNGVNSKSQHAQLFIVNLETGVLINRIDTEEMSSGQPNGLFSPVAVSLNSQKTIDYVYAGDYQGNLWRFDLDKKMPTVQKVFTTGNINQPITAKPLVVPSAEGLRVYFGTGEMFTEDTKIKRKAQAFYGIVDNLASPTITLDQLAERNILKQSVLTTKNSNESSSQTYNYRTITPPPPNREKTRKGFYVNLVYDKQEEGERVIAQASFDYPDRIRFSSVILSKDPCSGGTKSWVYNINAKTGYSHTDKIFDLNIHNMDIPFLAGIEDTEGSGHVTVVSSLEESKNILIGGNKLLPQEINKSAGRQSWTQLSR